MPEPILAEFVVDFPSLISLLSNFLYKDKSAAIRELLSNADDALVARKREDGVGLTRPEIRIWLDHQAARLTIADNGIGMSKTDLTDYLATIGASLARLRSSEHPEEMDWLIGKFGVGFLAAFIVADKVTVITRRAENPGYRWESVRIGGPRIGKQAGSSQQYTITECEVSEIGTTVMLDLNDEIRHVWNEDLIKRLVLENARHFVFPIYWGVDGAEKLNDLQAPWYQDKSPGEKDLDGYRSFLEKYGDRFSSAGNATEIIPLHSGDVRGVLYVPPASAYDYETIGLVDLYCKRVFVTRDHNGLVPKGFRFVMGIVDGYRFRLSASRDDVQRDNHEYAAIQEFIGIRILDHFVELGKTALTPEKGEEDTKKAEVARMRLQTFFDRFHFDLKHALTVNRVDGSYALDDKYLRGLERHMPFRSSTGLMVTVPEYLDAQAKAGLKREILYVRSPEEYNTLRVIAENRRTDFIWTQHEVELKYLQRYGQTIGLSCVPAQDRLQDAFPKLPGDSGWEKILRYYQDQLNHPEFTISAILSEFDPEAVAGRLVPAPKSEGHLKLEHMVREMEQAAVISKSDSLYRELDRVRQKQPHLLYINSRNPVLKRLAQILYEGGTVPLDQLLHPLFHDIIAAAGLKISEEHLTEYQVKVYDAALESSVSQAHIKALKNELDTEKKHAAAALEAERAKSAEAIETERARTTSAEQQRESLRGELDKIRVASPGQKTTDEVFFIRPLKDGFVDHLSKRVGQLCVSRALKFIDPKTETRVGSVLNQITEILRRAKFVIAEISEITNANVYFEAGFVEGNFPGKLILIARKDAIDGKLPFDFLTQRILEYTEDAVGFDKFLGRLEITIEGVLSELNR